MADQRRHGSDDNQDCADGKEDQRVMVLQPHPLRRPEQNTKHAEGASRDAEANDSFGGYGGAAWERRLFRRVHLAENSVPSRRRNAAPLGSQDFRHIASSHHAFRESAAIAVVRNTSNRVGALPAARCCRLFGPRARRRRQTTMKQNERTTRKASSAGAAKRTCRTCAPIMEKPQCQARHPIIQLCEG